MIPQVPAFLHGIARRAVGHGLRTLTDRSLPPSLPRRRIARLAEDDPRVRIHTLRPGGWVPVTPAAAWFDRRPGTTALKVTQIAGGFPTFPAGAVALPGATFHLPSGLMTCAGAIPSEALVQEIYPHPEQAWGLAQLRRAPRGVDDGILAMPPFSANYYHWVAEVLPAVLDVAGAPGFDGLPLFVHAQAPGFIRESLDFHGLGARVRALPTGTFHAGTLVAPVFPGLAEWPSRDGVLRVRGHGDPGHPAAPVPRDGTGVFVSRRDASGRRVVNEDDVLEALEDLGIRPVVLSGRTYREQRELLRRSRYVIGSHGAGLTNIVFAAPRATLVELAGARYTSCFHILASHVGARYAYVACAPRGADMLAEPRAVRALVEHLIHTEDPA